jgi:transcription initiation factor TFIIB
MKEITKNTNKESAINVKKYFCEISQYYEGVPGIPAEKKKRADEEVKCEKCNSYGVPMMTTIFECKICGEILENVIDNSAEWRYYGSENGSRVDPTRCGTAVNHLLPKSSMATIMLSSGMTNYSQRRTQKMHGWGSMTYKERCLNKVFQDISLRSLNGCILTSIVKTAHEFYKKVSELHASRGEIRKGLIAASVYMACKKIGVPRTTTEVAEIFQVSERCVSRGNKKFTELWQLSGEKHITYNDDCQSSEYLVRFCSKLDRGNIEFLDMSVRISYIIKQHSLLEQNTPVSVSAASIYFVCTMLKNTIITRFNISKITNTSEVTIAKCLKILMLNEDLIKSELPSNYFSIRKK